MGSLVPQNGGGNALATTGGYNPFLEVAKGISDGAYLKFNGNKGDITFGSDDEDLPEKSLIIVDMNTFSLGWICWDNSAVVEEIMVDVITGQKPPMEHELKDHGPYEDEDDGWREAASVSAILYSYGEDTQDDAVGQKLLFKTSTGGQVRSLKKLSGQYGRIFMQHPGQMAIVELTVESYMPKVKKHGRKYSLVMKIVGWISEAEAEAMMAGGGDDEGDYEPEEKPKRVAARDEAPEEVAPARGRRAAPEPEPEEAPVRGRRAAAPVEADEEEEEAPAPVRGRRREPEPADDEEAAPAPRGRSATRRGSAPVEEAAPEDDGQDDIAPVRGRGRAAPVEEPAEEEEAPRRGRGAPSNARLRKFD